MARSRIGEEVHERLVGAGCVAADDEAAELLAHAPDTATLLAWVDRRVQGEPLAWIVGGTRFCGRWVGVERGVFVPRAQSAELACRAADLLPEAGRAADLCTGSGAIAAYLAWARPRAQVVGTDIDVRAATCARRNGVATLRTDLDHGLCDGAFDVVTAVAPYVPTDALDLLPPDVTRYEPRGALDGGMDGMDCVRRLVPGAARLLRPGGSLLIEIAGGEEAIVEPILAAAGFSQPVYWADTDGDLRGLAARRVGTAAPAARACRPGPCRPRNVP